MRQLASVKRISKIMDIQGKDRIGLAMVDGWTVIVQKSDYKDGDLCVYVEIDSILPEKPEFEFLRSKDFRIRTMKMAGCISQGICFPLSILPDGEYNEGDDVTDVIGVKKWEREDATDVKEKVPKKRYPKWIMRIPFLRNILVPKKLRKGFPDFISKTDETRIQNAPFYLEMNKKWVVTEKVDGQSGTFAVVKKRFFGKYDYIVCSRNYQLYTPDNSSYWSVSERYNIKRCLEEMCKEMGVKWLAIQGECIAPGVQGNKYKVDKPDLYVFNLITPIGRIGSVEAKEIVEKYGFKFVPIIGVMELPKDVSEMLKMAHGKSELHDTLREGLVCRTEDGKMSFKSVDPEFLIKYCE